MQILDTAEELFSRSGYYSTSLKDVAEYCDFSVGAIYTYFTSKEDLYDAVLNRYSEENTRRLIEILQGDGDPIDQLVAVALFQIECFCRHPAWGRLVTRTLSPGLQSQETRSPVMKAADTTYRHILDLEAHTIMRGQETGHIRAGNPLVLARVYANLINSYHTMVFGEEEFATEFSVEELVALIRHTLSP